MFKNYLKIALRNLGKDKLHAGINIFGLAIGFTVTTCAYAFGGVSGGAFNPAVAVGISIKGISGMADIWIYLVANFAAAAAAAYTFLFVNGRD